MFYQLKYFPCQRTDNGRGSGDEILDRNFKANVNPLPVARNKRSISDKVPSRRDKRANRQLDLAAKLRLEPKSVKDVNAYFGLVKRDQPANGQASHGKTDARKITDDSNAALKGRVPVNDRKTLEKPDTIHEGSFALALAGVQFS